MTDARGDGRRPTVSVIVPFFGRPEELRACVAGLLAQSYPPNAYEVIVVDNGSPVPAGEILGADLPVTFRVIHEARAGSYTARNTGVRASMGEILAFTDADCVPEPEWIERAMEHLASAGPCLLAGHVDRTVRGRRPTLLEWYDALTYFDQQYCAARGFPMGCNLIVPRGVFEAAGGFDGTLKSGGDALFGFRVREKGYPLLYSPDARVFHAPCRSWRAYMNRQRRIAGGCHDKIRAGLASGLDAVHRDLAAPFKVLPHCVASPALRGGQRFAFFGMTCFLHAVRFLERVRLLCGGRSRRA